MIENGRLQRQKRISSIRWLLSAAWRLLYDDKRMYDAVCGARGVIAACGKLLRIYLPILSCNQ